MPLFFAIFAVTLWLINLIEFNITIFHWNVQPSLGATCASWVAAMQRGHCWKGSWEAWWTWPLHTVRMWLLLPLMKWETCLSTPWNQHRTARLCIFWSLAHCSGCNFVQKSPQTQGKAAAILFLTKSSKNFPLYHFQGTQICAKRTILLFSFCKTSWKSGGVRYSADVTWIICFDLLRIRIIVAYVMLFQWSVFLLWILTVCRLFCSSDITACELNTNRK